ncbi:MAG: transporter substrate-binding domain-containing protein [Clostridia bacterium]
MKKLLALALAMSMTFAITACSSSSSTSTDVTTDTATTDTATTETTTAPETTVETTEEESAELELIKEGVLVVGTEAKYAPYEFVMLDESGKEVFAGFDMDLAREIAADMGLELEIVDLPFDSIMLELQAGNIDMAIAGLSPKEERQAVADFSQIYFAAEQAVVINSANADVFVDQASLAGYQVAAQNGSIQADHVLEDMVESTFVGYADIPEILYELKLGNVSAAIIEAPVIEALLAENPDLMIIDSFIDEDKEGNVVCVKKEAPNLLTSVDETITRLLDDGTMDQFVADAYIAMDQAIDY